MIPLVLFLVLLFGFSLLSRRLAATIVTPPMVFTIFGMMMYGSLPVMLKAGLNPTVFLRLAEVGLVLLLFTDASRIDLRLLRATGSLPVRLLSIGMLLTIALGAMLARWVFPHLSLWEAGILAAILAPTDAGLGQVIVESPRVPHRIREALNVEAGLNDGLSVPFLLFFIALAAAKTEGGAASLMQYIVEQLGFGALVGLAVGIGGGWLFGMARRKSWIAESFEQIAVVVIPLFCLVAAEMVHASMFIAAFAAGLAMQIGCRDFDVHSGEFGERCGQLVNLAVFFLFGMLVVRNWAQFTGAAVLYAVLSLTVVRMITVAIALIGTGLDRANVIFIGWFGPRGLASIVLGLVYLEQESHLPAEPSIKFTVMMTVLISIFAHGISAKPGISLYAAQVKVAGDAETHAAD